MVPSLQIQFEVEPVADGCPQVRARAPWGVATGSSFEEAYWAVMRLRSTA